MTCTLNLYWVLRAKWSMLARSGSARVVTITDLLSRDGCVGCWSFGLGFFAVLLLLLIVVSGWDLLTVSIFSGSVLSNLELYVSKLMFFLLESRGLL